MYQSFCSKYGKSYARAGMYRPYAITAAIGMATGSYGTPSILIGMSGALGAIAATTTEFILPVIMRRNKVGVTRGTKILQQTQVGAYAAIVSAFALSAAVVASQPEKAAAPTQPQSAVAQHVQAAKL